MAFYDARRRGVFGFDKSEALVGYWLHDYAFEARVGGICRNAGHCFPQPFANTSVGIVVEAVHALRAHAFVEHIAVPSFPYGGGTIVDRVEPTWIIALE